MKCIFTQKIKSPVVLIIILLAFLSASTVTFANKTIISTTVPSCFTLRIEIEGEGSVNVSGQEFSKDSIAYIERNKKVEFLLMPNRDFCIEEIKLNGENITDSLQENVFALDKLETDSELTVIFAREESSGNISKTGDSTGSLYVYIILALVMCTILGLLLVKKKKE